MKISSQSNLTKFISNAFPHPFKNMKSHDQKTRREIFPRTMNKKRERAGFYTLGNINNKYKNINNNMREKE